MPAAFDALPNPVFVKDRDLRYLVVNEAYCRLRGRPRDEIVGRSDADLDPAEEAAQSHRRDNHVIASTERFEGEAILTDPTGRRHSVFLSLTPFDLPDGQRGLVGSVSDLTLHRRMEMELQEGRQHLARAQRMAAIGSFERNILTGRGAFSEEALRIAGLADGEKVERVPEEVLALIHEADRPQVASAVLTILKGGSVPSFDVRLVRPDGDVRIVHLTYGPTRNDDGDIIGFMGSLQDVTDLRRLEGERRTLERQLHHAQRLEALGTLAGGIAHDLNNTLVPVLNLPKLVMKHLPPDSRDRDNLLLIEKAGKRARSLVRQILDFSRKQVPKMALFRLDLMVRDGLPLLRASIPATIAIEERISDVPPLMGDQDQFFQVLLNLMMNAAQAIGSGQGKIEVSVDHGAADGTEPSGATVTLTVGDDGAGMDEETRQRVFEPFFTTKPVGVGSGLGLAVVHGIVTAHGGRIDVISAPRQGAKFVVTLPAAPMT
jgi:PAS domain S-box-containing protein